MSCGMADRTVVWIHDAGVQRILLARFTCVYSVRTSDFFYILLSFQGRNSLFIK